jgi:hypothetical protein
VLGRFSHVNRLRPDYGVEFSDIAEVEKRAAYSFSDACVRHLSNKE